MNNLEMIVRRVNLNYQHSKMIEYFIKNKVYSYKIVEANPDYYNLTLQQRMDLLGAHSIDVLCKTIILENTAYDDNYHSDFYKRYYVTIVQYTNEFNAEKIAKLMKSLQNAKCEHKLSNKYFHFRLAKNDVAYDMTGYRFNCITPFLMKADNLQILLPENLFYIEPRYFWLGGGELELKVGISLEDFKRLFNDKLIIGDISSNNKVENKGQSIQKD